MGPNYHTVIRGCTVQQCCQEHQSLKNQIKNEYKLLNFSTVIKRIILPGASS